METTKNPKWEEIIIVAKRSEVFENEKLTFQGSLSDKASVDKIMYNIDKCYKTMRRGNVLDSTAKSKNAEVNLDYLQPIPYIVIKRGNQYYATKRLSGAGESRLHGKIAMGAGGHMNPLEDWRIIHDVVKANTERELEEELEITGTYDLRVVGLINDDSDNVNRVHLGILGFLELEDSGEVCVREVDQLQGNWYTIEELLDSYEQLENWGKIVVDMVNT